MNQDAVEEEEPNSSSSAAAAATFAPNDPTNPRNFSARRKWAIIASIGLIDLTVSFGASGYSPALSDLTHDFGVSHTAGQLGLSLYVLGLAFGPMFIAPLSEYYGRTALYVIPYGIFLVFLAGTAVVRSLAGFLALRFASGVFASVTIANFGGTIADLFARHEVGPAMNVFLWAAVCGSPMGFFFISVAVAQGGLGWRGVFWTLLAICGVCWVQLVVVLVPFGNETRHSVLLRRRARREGRRIPGDVQARSLRSLFKITIARPFRFLSMETIVIFGALYNGFLYGLTFMFNGSFGVVFGRDGYGFDTMGVGCAFLGLVIGISLGPVVGIWQERYYQRKIREEEKKPSEGRGETQPLLRNQDHHTKVRYIPEARIRLSKLAAVLLPISLFWFAWTSPPQYHIHYMVPILATVLFGFSFFTLIFMIAVYTEESYMVYSASALAGIGLSRNLFGALFPLFGVPLYQQLGFNWAGTVIALLACLLAPIPFILERYGTKLRARSPFAWEHAEEQ